MSARTSVMTRCLCSVAGVAIVISVGAWVIEGVEGRRETEQSFYALINTQSEMRAGDLCHAYANVYNGTAPYTYLWSGDLWYGDTQIVSAYMNYPGEGLYQKLDVWDANMNHDDHERSDLVVKEGGSECVW